MPTNDNIRHSASERQGGDKYPGIDTYAFTTLKRRTKICALVAYYEDGHMKPCEFYFPENALAEVGFNCIRLSQGLQIRPWKDPQTNIYSYRNRVATFIVTEDFEVEYSPHALENSSYGQGGIPQYHISPADAKRYLIKEPEDTILPDGHISEEEYEQIMEKHQQLLIKRNLFSHLKAKSDALDILQNTTDKSTEEKTKENIETLNRHIENLIVDLAVSQEKVGDVVSQKYDHLISQIVNELEIRERKDTLIVCNVKTTQEIENTVQQIDHLTDNWVMLPQTKDETVHMAENITKKMYNYEKEMSSGGKPEIDVPQQNLSDILHINRLNEEAQNLIIRHTPKELDFSSITTLSMRTQNGPSMQIPIENIFTQDSVKTLRNAQNGIFTPLLRLQNNGSAKLLLRGNKAQLFLSQTKEQLSQRMDFLRISPRQREELLEGKALRIGTTYYTLDKDLNCLIPQTPNVDFCQQKVVSQTKIQKGPNKKLST